MPVIEVDNLVKYYDNRPVVDDVSFAVDEGEVFGIVGPNGAGKTTTVECIEGLRVPDRGRTRVCGLDPRTQEAQLRQVLGAQLQQSGLPDKLTVAEAMSLYSSFYRAPLDWHDLLEILGLTAEARTQYRRLSGGQQQRLAIALGLLGNPRVAVLDELTTGLDPQSRRDTWDLIERVRDQGRTILLVTHFMEEAERLCDRVAVFDTGRIVATGSPAELISSIASEQRIRFRLSAPLEPGELTSLPVVHSVTQRHGRYSVSGTDGVLQAVLSVLGREQIVPTDLQIDQPSLEDAFVALTGRTDQVKEP